jgi:hypothetical protein
MLSGIDEDCHICHDSCKFTEGIPNTRNGKPNEKESYTCIIQSRKAECIMKFILLKECEVNPRFLRSFDHRSRTCTRVRLKFMTFVIALYTNTRKFTRDNKKKRHHVFNVVFLTATANDLWAYPNKQMRLTPPSAEWKKMWRHNPPFLGVPSGKFLDQPLVFILDMKERKHKF